MKAVGIARAIDQLGRIVLPASLRRQMGLAPGDLLEISVEEGRIVLDRVIDTCALCGCTEDLAPINSRHVCRVCIESLTRESV